MDFDTIRPIISGLVGAIIAGWLATKWKKWIPHSNNDAKQKELIQNHKKLIGLANIGAGIVLLAGLVLYLGEFLDSHDWRGFGIIVGLIGLLPLLVIALGNWRGGISQIREGLTAYALTQKTPPVLLFSLMGLMIAGGIWATIAFTLA